MLRKLLKGIWGTVCALLVIVVFMAICIRLVLPDINNYQDEILAWFNNELGYAVRMGDLSGSWRAWTPLIKMSDVQVLDQSGQSVLMLDEIYARLDLIQSLWLRQLVPSALEINGLTVTVVRHKDGAFSISGQQFNAPQLSGAAFASLGGFLDQIRIVIANSEIRLLDEASQRPVVALSNISALFAIDGEHLQLDIKARLPAEQGGRLQIALDLKDASISSGWSGQMYAAGFDVPLSIVEDLRPILPTIPEFDLQGGQATIQIWSDWQAAKAVAVYGTFAAEKFAISMGHAPLQIEKLHAHYTAMAEDNDWVFGLQLIEAATQHGAWPPGNYALLMRAGYAKPYIAQLSHLELADLWTLFPVVQFAPIVSAQAAQGVLQEVLLTIDSERDSYTYALRLIDLKFAAVSGLSGYLQGDNNGGQLTLDAKQLTLQLPQNYSSPVNLSRLAGEVRWTQAGDVLHLMTEYLQLDFPDFSSITKGQLTYAIGQRITHIDLIQHISGTTLSNFLSYCEPIVPDNMHKWLEKDTFSGSLNSLDIVMRGDPMDFPFRAADGQFLALASISDAVINYDTAWPPVYEAEATIQLKRSSVTTYFSAGEVLNSQISKAMVSVADIEAPDATLRVMGMLNGGSESLSRFIKYFYSTDEWLHKLAELQLVGEMAIDFMLDIPLYDAPNISGGSVYLTDTSVRSDTFGVSFEAVNGAISFANNKILSAELSARYLTQPIQITIDNDAAATNILFTGQIDRTLLSAQLHNLWPEAEAMKEHVAASVTGTSDWQLLINIPLNAGVTQREQLVFSSDLVGLAVDLPAPLGKLATEPRSLQVITDLDETGLGDLQIAYGSDLQIMLKPTPQQIQITGSSNYIHLSKWLTWMSALPTDEVASTTAVSIDLQMAKAMILDIPFSDISLQLTGDSTGWDAWLNGGALSGKLWLAADRQQGGIDFSRLILPAMGAEITDIMPQDMLPQNMPALQASIAQLHIGETVFDKLSFITTQHPSGMEIADVLLTRPGLSILGKGQWLYSDGQHQSQLDVTLNADSLQDFFLAFQQTKANTEDGAISLHALLEWPASPMAFSLESMFGTMNLDIVAGKFNDFDLGASRFLTLLDIRVLMRILAFKFSGIFAEGVSFSKINGDFELQGGVLETKHLLIENDFAYVNFAGHTGLVEQDYNQIATVVPKFTGSLPLFMGLLGPVGIGTGAAIYVFGEWFDFKPFNLDQLIKLQYRITGHWDDPQIEPLRRIPANTEHKPLG